MQIAGSMQIAGTSYHHALDHFDAKVREGNAVKRGCHHG